MLLIELSAGLADPISETKVDVNMSWPCATVTIVFMIIMAIWSYITRHDQQ